VDETDGDPTPRIEGVMTTAGTKNETTPPRVSSPTDRIVVQLRSISTGIDNVVGVVCMVTAGLMTIIVILGVFFRYVLVKPLMWSEEAAIYSMMWMGFLGISSALVRDEHVRLQFIVKKLPIRLALAADYVIKLLIFFFLVVLTREGFIMTKDAIGTQTSPALQISMAWPLASVPLAGFLTLLQLVIKLLIDSLDLLMKRNGSASERIVKVSKTEG
jgi:TRAP-type C4-dicarboxylate transport system permease small subunit